MHRDTRLGNQWMEYQGSKNWEGLLHPLNDNLQAEILRYGKFVEATYNSFDFDPSSPTYATCRFSKQSLLSKSGLQKSGYTVTKNLHATSGVRLPRWTKRLPRWVSNRSSWIGYVAVCEDEEEIARLGRRDVVVAFRGTATCMEWVENLRASLTHLPNSSTTSNVAVQKGFLSLYTSNSSTSCSLQDEIREEISRIIESYGCTDRNPLSLTITGHSLGAALATLAAYDITTMFNHGQLVTVISFGGPRVGNQSFRHHIEKRGSKVLRIVNSNDIITKVPGFVIEDDVADDEHVQLAGVCLPSWLTKSVEHTKWVYADVGSELQLCSGDSPLISSRSNTNVSTCHDLETYLQLVKSCINSTAECPLKKTAKKLLSRESSRDLSVT
ncbi:hypothetical protein Scep_026622 [Stephania cephalantha]|uniref:Fungal lipase-type domain-containing protein n=1 Tax=Stephania cephalantha TaxID=152367 RepID=A0AAP0ESR8_9MAGN